MGGPNHLCLKMSFDFYDIPYTEEANAVTRASDRLGLTCTVGACRCTPHQLAAGSILGSFF